MAGEARRGLAELAARTIDLVRRDAPDLKLTRTPIDLEREESYPELIPIAIKGSDSILDFQRME